MSADKPPVIPDELKSDKPKVAPEESPIVKHARNELTLAGLSTLMGVGLAVMDLVKTYAKQPHTSGTAQLTITAFTQLLSGDLLAPPLHRLEEWKKVEDSKEPLWRNLRNPNYFSKDGGKTWFNMQTQTSGKSLEPEDWNKKLNDQKERMNEKAQKELGITQNNEGNAA